MSNNEVEITFRNTLIGERRKSIAHILVLPCEPEYSTFLKSILEKYEVKSKFPIISFFAGGKIIVISGKGLKCKICDGIPIKGELKELYEELNEKISEVSDIVSRIYEWYFEDKFGEDEEL